MRGTSGAVGGAVNKLLLGLVVCASACLQPVDDGAPVDSGVTGDAGVTRDAGSTVDAGPVLFGLARPDCAPNDGPAWQFYLSEVPVSCTTPLSEGFYVNLWTGVLDVRSYAFPTEGTACLCGALGDTSSSGTVRIDSVSDAGVTGRIDATFQSGTVRHDAFQLIICPGAAFCG